MGQRSQILVRVPNPVKHLTFATQAEKERAIAMFGTDKTTFLSYHNQWCYGRSLVQQCLNLLNFAKNFTKKEILSKYGEYNIPYSIVGYNHKFRTIEKITSTIGFIMNFRPENKDWLKAGIGESFFVGGDVYDIELREDFTRGDNNDGVIIVDMINKKYCFVNPYSKDKERANSVRHLPKCKPFDAHSYVKCYYGETIKTTNPYHLENKTKEQQQEYVNQQIKINAELVKGFEKFKVFTLEELDVLFPKMLLIKKNKTIIYDKNLVVKN